MPLSIPSIEEPPDLRDGLCLGPAAAEPKLKPRPDTKPFPRLIRSAGTGCALAVFLFGAAASPQSPPVATVPATSAGAAPDPATTAPGPMKISYVGGVLKIHATDVTLAAVLAKVAVLTGVKIDVPEDASSEPMAFVDVGPGSPVQVLTDLLSDSGFDFMVLGTDADAGKLQSVTLMARSKKTNTPTLADASRPGRAPYTRAAAPPAVEPPPADDPAPAQPDNSTAAVTPVEPQQPPLAQPAATSQMPAISADQASQFPLLQQDPAFPGRPGAYTPPSVMSPTNISQQLQQMYQQRMLINQQTQGLPAAAPGK